MVCWSFVRFSSLCAKKTRKFACGSSDALPGEGNNGWDLFKVSADLRLTFFYDLFFTRFFWLNVESLASLVSFVCNGSNKGLSQVKQAKTYCCFYYLWAIHWHEPSETLNDHNHIFTSSIEFLFQLNFFFFLSYKIVRNFLPSTFTLLLSFFTLSFEFALISVVWFILNVISVTPSPLTAARLHNFKCHLSIYPIFKLG